MNRKIVLLASLAFLAAGAATVSAAPVTYVGAPGGNIGYEYNGAKDGVHSVYMEIAPIPKVVLGAEFRDWNDEGHETDVYAKYRLGHFYVGVGNRNYYDRDAKVYGLVEGMTNIAPRLDAYASLKASSEEKEYKAGVTYDLLPQIDLDVNYTYYDRDNTSNEDGVGVGINYRF
jgi:opacity protein-like surface antigen